MLCELPGLRPACFGFCGFSSAARRLAPSREDLRRWRRWAEEWGRSWARRRTVRFLVQEQAQARVRPRQQRKLSQDVREESEGESRFVELQLQLWVFGRVKRRQRLANAGSPLQGNGDAPRIVLDLPDRPGK